MIRHPFTRLIPALAAAAIALTACGTSDDADVPGAVTVRSCGKPLTVAGTPTRAVARDTTMVEMLFALGLRDRMAAFSNYEPAKRRTPLPEYRQAFASLRFLGAGPLTTEALVGARTDFLFAGWNYGLNQATGVTPERLATRGIPTYVLSETCRVRDPGLPAPTLATVWDDVRNVARIFGVQERADRVIAAWRARTDAVERRVRGARRVPVFAYVSGTTTPFTGSGLSVLSDLVRRAGGRNVAEDVEKVWAPVAWETMIASRPELIVIGDYGGEETPEQKIAFLKRKRTLRDIPAILENRFLVLPSEALNPGVRNAWGIESIAHALHPDRVPAPGPVLDDVAREPSTAPTTGDQR
jgi:iron complex transport system substrate-binding protein